VKAALYLTELHADAKRFCRDDVLIQSINHGVRVEGLEPPVGFRHRLKRPRPSPLGHTPKRCGEFYGTPTCHRDVKRRSLRKSSPVESNHVVPRYQRGAVTVWLDEVDVASTAGEDRTPDAGGIGTPL
jgi:hypothetical protein